MVSPGPWLARLARSFSEHAVLAIGAAVGAALVTGLTAASAEVYEAVVEQDGIAVVDRPALTESVRLRTPLNVRLVTWFTDLGGPVAMTIIAVGLTVALALRWRSRTPLVLMPLAAAGSLAMTIVGKAAVGRARPPLVNAVPPYEYAFSFPSGHALNSTVIAGMVAYLVLRRWRTPTTRLLVAAAALAWAVGMGLSRVFLGHHWLTDVIVAWLLGLAWLALLITAHRLFLAVRRLRRSAGTTPRPRRGRESPARPDRPR